MLLDFEADMTPKTQPRQVAPPRVVEVTETITVAQIPSESRAYLTRDPAAWTWSDLRDYVVHEIEARFGTWPRDSKREYGIFNRFAREHGALAGPIAKYAFEQKDGFWAGAPISVNRFCKGSDAYFAEPIKDRLNDRVAPTQGW
jgi:hypothetical protein